MRQGKILSVLVLLSLMSVSIGADNACASDVTELAGVTVEGDRYYAESDKDPLPGGYQNRKATIGIMGTYDTMDVPFQQNNLSEKTIKTFGADQSTSISSVLVNVPSVRTVGNTVYNDFSIRGQAANGYQLRINGVPGLFSQTNIPVNWYESAEVTSGPGVGLTGTQATESAGGVIDLVTKRAKEKDITDYTLFYTGRSTIGNQIDLSRRFGENKAWGIRVNGLASDGDTAIKNEKLRNDNISINIDHQSKRSSTNLFLGYRDTHTSEAQRYFDFSNANLTHIPSAPDGKNNYNFEGQKLGMKTWMAVLNHTQQITDSFKVFVNTGYSYNNGYDYLVTSSSRLDVINDAGDLQRVMTNEPFTIRNGFFQLGANKVFNIGKVKNDVTFAVDKDWYAARWGSSVSHPMVRGNLYEGNSSHMLIADGYTDYARKAVYSGKSQYYGWTLADTLSYNKWDITVGVHHHTASVISSSHVKTKSDATSPLYAVVYKPNNNWSIFANHSESFHRGTVAGSYANAGEVLDPAKTKNNEIGAKYTNGNLVTSLSYFDMKQDATMESNRNGQTYLNMNGENRFKGVEWSISGKVAPKWTLSGGLMYIDSEYKKNTSKYLSGKTVRGVSDWSAVAIAEYDPNDSLGLWGRMVYTGSAPIYTNDNRELDIGSSTIFDVGVRYDSHISKIPVTYNFTVYNVFDKDYWLPRPTYNYGILGNPRTYFISAQFHF